jgi:hypothetical protein
MLKHKHMKLDQGKIEMAKRILLANTETETIDKALNKVIQSDHERLRRKNVMKRIIELRKSVGKIEEDSADWVRLARQERNLSRESSS